MKQFLTTIIFWICLPMATIAQVRYAGKIEMGYQYYLFRTITVDPGPNWKGYNLNERQNGYNITSVNGLTFANGKLFTGIGVGYSNFEGIDGVSVFGDLEYLPIKNIATPLFNLRLGYNHIWNQYQGGTGTMYTEIGIGENYRLSEKLGIYIKSGILITQQSLFVPITLGFRY